MRPALLLLLGLLGWPLCGRLASEIGPALAPLLEQAVLFIGWLRLLERLSTPNASSGCAS